MRAPGNDKLDRLKSRLDLCPARLQKRRQRQMLAELVHRFICRKARTVRRDLEQDAVRLSEVERAEVEPLDFARRRHPQPVQVLRPVVDRRSVGDAKRHVVDRARARQARKRGGEGERVPVDLDLLGASYSDAELIDTDATLDALDAEDSNAAELVRLHVFGGFSIEEVASRRSRC